MERRKTPDRRKENAFIATDRRIGPVDRRYAEERLRQRRQREKELEKIAKIKAYKERDAARKSSSPNSETFKRLAILGALLVLAILVYFFVA